MDKSKTTLTFYVTMMVSATLCIIVLAIMFALLEGLYAAEVDNGEVFKLITPVLQTIVGGFIGLLAGIKLAHEDNEKEDCKK